MFHVKHSASVFVSIKRGSNIEFDPLSAATKLQPQTDNQAAISNTATQPERQSATQAPLKAALQQRDASRPHLRKQSRLDRRRAARCERCDARRESSDAA